MINVWRTFFSKRIHICCRSCKKALYTLPLITIRELKRIKTAQKCIFLRTKTNLLQLFSSIYNSQFLWGNILHKPNKYKVLCPNTFKLVAIPKVGQNITSKKIFFKIWKVSSRDYPEGGKVLEQCSSRRVERMSAILYKLS